MSRDGTPDHGAFVVSLDFELHWGVRDLFPAEGAYTANLRGAREAVPRILALFDEFRLHATWATVGILFARSRDEMEAFRPARRPSYADRRLDSYQEAVGADETTDPLHFAPTLVEEIRKRSGQEIATHTFSHYYCLERGQDRSTFEADLDAAISIAKSRGTDLRSIVFPRNQHEPTYDDVLRSRGIVCYRGADPGWMNDPSPRARKSPPHRIARLLNSHAPLSRVVQPWSAVRQPSGLANVRGGLFLRPVTPRRPRLTQMRLRRVIGAIEEAAASRGLFHLWWHPHNFGVDLEENLRMLRSILEAFERARDSRAMRSLSMSEAADAVRR